MSQSPIEGKPDSDKRLELAYDAGNAILGIQSETLGNVRSRANNLLATSALLTSFASGIGLLNTDPKKGTVLPASAAWLLLIATVIVGTFVIYVLWPAKSWGFGADPREIVRLRKAGKSEDAIREYVVDAMNAGIESNEASLKKKQLAFQFTAVFLLVEVVLLIASLVLQK